jgi:hypothetical protein
MCVSVDSSSFDSLIEASIWTKLSNREMDLPLSLKNFETNRLL